MANDTQDQFPMSEEAQNAQQLMDCYDRIYEKARKGGQSGKGISKEVQEAAILLTWWAERYGAAAPTAKKELQKIVKDDERSRRKAVEKADRQAAASLQATMA